MIHNLPVVTSMPVTDVSTVDLPTDAVIALDDLTDLVRLEQLLCKHIQEQEEELAKVQARIQEAMGEAESATVEGREVYTWKRINGMNQTKFKKAYPAIAKAYTDLVEKEVLNIDLLRQTQPEIFREFQTRQFKHVG